MLDDAEAEGRLLAYATRYAFEGGTVEDLQARLEDVERRLDGSGPAAVLVQASLARLASSEGRRDDALRWSEAALTLAQSLRDDHVLRTAAGARSFALLNADRQFEAACWPRGSWRWPPAAEASWSRPARQ